MFCENGGWNVEAANDMVEDELRDLNSHSYNKRDCFNLVSKVVYGYCDPFVNFGR